MISSELGIVVAAAGRGARPSQLQIGEAHLIEHLASNHFSDQMRVEKGQAVLPAVAGGSCAEVKAHRNDGEVVEGRGEAWWWQMGTAVKTRSSGAPGLRHGGGATGSSRTKAMSRRTTPGLMCR
uniref:Uncharacterized protein n=1 Tax=Arundo donax TaxID=35708 RepID=A0A0A9BCU3_ARUDO